MYGHNLNPLLIQDLISKYGHQVTRKNIFEAGNRLKVSFRPLLGHKNIMSGRGTYDLSKLGISEEELNIEPPKIETDEEILARIESRFKALSTMSKAAAMGKTRALIISGPAGLGKTHEVMHAVTEGTPRFSMETDKITGYVRPTGLYKALFEHQRPGQVLVFDDADSIFADDTGLNLLKAACDTTDERWISWRSETKMEDSDGDRLPNYFRFDGTIIFITNYDFTQIIAKGHRLAPHFEALISRSHYLDLEMKTPRDYLVRIRQVMKKGLADLAPKEQDEVYDFLVENQNKIRDLSLRKVIKIAQLKNLQSDWKELALQLQ